MGAGPGVTLPGTAREVRGGRAPRAGRAAAAGLPERSGGVTGAAGKRLARAAPLTPLRRGGPRAGVRERSLCAAGRARGAGSVPSSGRARGQGFTLDRAVFQAQSAKAHGVGKAQFLAARLFLLAEPAPALDKAGM